MMYTSEGGLVAIDVWMKLWNATTPVIVQIWESFREQEEKKAASLLVREGINR